MKTLKLKNYNNKLHSSFFIHAMQAPVGRISENKLETTEYLITSYTQDVEPFSAKIISFFRVRLMDLPELITYLDTGETPQQFQTRFLLENKTSSLDTMIAVYLFKKTNGSAKTN